QVTRHQASLLDLQWLEVPDMALEEVEYLSSNMICRLRRVLNEQDHCRKLVVTMTQEWNTSSRPIEDTQHLAMELADTKATLRGVRQELEEKTKQLADTRHQLYQLVLELQEARHNNMELAASAQAARAPLPELDYLREKVNPMERLEMEAMGLRQKEKDIDFYAAAWKEKVRTGDDYSMDTKGHLQEHWIRYWIDKLFEREEENVQLKSKLHHLQLDRDTYQKCLEELWEENMALKTAQGQSVEESAHLRWELEQLSEAVQCDKAPRDSHVFLLNKPPSSCFLKLDQEKQSLQDTIQGLPEASLARQESSLQRRELEEENQQLRKQIEDLRVQMEREKQTSQVLETLCEELVEEREQLLRDKKTLKAERAQEVVPCQEFKDLKKVVHSLRDSSQTGSKARMKGRKTEQKVLLQTVTDTKRKVTMMEWERRQLCRDLEQVKEHVLRAQELEQELHRLQEEIEKLAMEVSALTTAPERVHALEWESQDLLLENQRLQTSLDTLKPEGLERDKQLGALNARLSRQVENSTLSSQSASHTALTEQDTQLQHQQLVAAHQALQQEHASLGALHEQLTKEHKALLDKYRRHKTLLRRTLELVSKALSDSDVELVRLETEGQEGPPGEQEELMSHTKKLQTSLKDTQLEVYRWQAQYEGLKGQQEELKTHSKKLQSSLNDLQLEVNHWKARYEKLKGEQEEMYTVTKKLQTQVNELLTDNKELLTDNKELLTDNKELLTDNKELLTDNEKLLTDNEELLTDNKELRTDNKELLTDNKELCTDIKELLTDNEELRTDNEELLTDNKELLTDYKELLTDYKELQMSLKNTQREVNHWQARYEELKGEQEEMYTVTKKLQTQVNELLTDNRELLTDNKALRTDNEELRTDKEELLTDNKELLTYNEELLTDNKELLTDNEELRTDYKELRTDYKELQMSLKDMQCEVNHWQAQYEELKGEQEKMYTVTKELQTHVKELLTDKKELLTDNKELCRDCKELLTDYKELKMSLKDTQREVNHWQGQYEGLKAEQEALYAHTKELQTHTKELLTENQELQTTLKDTQQEVNRWQGQYEELKGEQEELQMHNKKLQTSLNDTQLEVNCWRNQCNWLREELQSRDISLTELDNHCQLLSHLKANLEGENRHLQSQIQSLTEKNQRLHQEDVENNYQHQEEQRQYVDKLNPLQRQNEKLEEKSMAQHKFHDPAPKKKKHWIGAKALVKLIKLKKGGSRERPKSTPERPPWPLGSSDQASPSTSQPLQSQLELLEATPCCSKGTEEQDTCRGLRGKGRKGLPGCRREVKGSICKSRNGRTPTSLTRSTWQVFSGGDKCANSRTSTVPSH
uniref:Coiled-coil domain containing 88C n=1 Tax=Myotis lucifugus TaxID=59463 RepID=G1PY49_MYOLU